MVVRSKQKLTAVSQLKYSPPGKKSIDHQVARYTCTAHKHAVGKMSGDCVGNLKRRNKV